jgi:hypothetical protein
LARGAPTHGPYGLLFVDGGGFKPAPEQLGDLVIALLEPGGFLVLDDMTPGWAGFDPVRAWTAERPELEAVELLTTPATSALVAVRVG